jgi:hypothetical protein
VSPLSPLLHVVSPLLPPVLSLTTAQVFHLHLRTDGGTGMWRAALAAVVADRLCQRAFHGVVAGGIEKQAMTVRCWLCFLSYLTI